MRIPHRPPILCIDEVVECDKDHAVTISVARGEWEGWLVEGLAQTAAVLNAEAYDETGNGMLVQVRRFDIARPPKAGERLTLRVDIVRRLPPLTLATGRATSGEETLAEGELKFYLESPA